MKGKNIPPEAKPFALVSIPPEAPQRREPVSHEKFTGLTGQLEVQFSVTSAYLFVGSGGYEFDPNAKGGHPDVWHTFYRRNGQICVPATTLKGAVRAVLEAITNSCVSQLSRQEERAKLVDKAHEKCDLRRNQGRLCPACRLFGVAGWRGRVHFADALPLGGEAAVKVVKIAELWEPKRPTKARRFYEAKKFTGLPRLYPERNHRFVEAVPQNTVFRTVLHFENLSEAELGLLLHAFGLEPRGYGYGLVFTPKLGGARPRCLGAVRFEPQALRRWQARDGKAWIHAEVKQGQELVRFLNSCLVACQSQPNLLHKPSWQALVRALQPKTDPCPRGVY
jgi:CRISPR/Cas system CSM-associated protein Csm3 (group 7 of RAMP superfamily)